MKIRLAWSNRPNQAAGTAAPPRPGGHFHPTESDRREPRRRDSTRELGRFRASSSTSSGVPPSAPPCPVGSVPRRRPVLPAWPLLATASAPAWTPPWRRDPSCLTSWGAR
ncbi:hypothetical protein GUJ93_ZPchr0001g29541 [Zizania palustris]|uniref:Uncharacterized protein n=1 Tax=Zizania palustris TaxID=103762 RepID=A0A8J5S063_ZIZPA|nr:hypothetical protein GUJ93_ZPchr0001g29541 [Zizania palustris]